MILFNLKVYVTFVINRLKVFQRIFNPVVRYIIFVIIVINFMFLKFILGVRNVRSFLNTEPIQHTSANNILLYNLIILVITSL